MLRQVLLLLALALCLSFVRSTSVPDDKQNVYANVTSADFFVSVNVNGISGLPVWKYNDKDNATTVYQVSFLGLWETENGTDYDLVYNSQVSEFISIVNLGGKVNSSQTVNVNLQGYDNFYLNFTTHVPLNDVGNKTSYPAGKFDINIGNYKWISDDEDAQLVLAFKLSYTKSVDNSVVNPNVSTSGSDTVQFADAYFSINDTAKAGTTAKNLSQSIDVSLKTASNLNSTKIPTSIAYSQMSGLVLVVYDNFNVDTKGVSFLNHDPEFGFGSGPSGHYMWIIIIVAVVVAIIVIILIAVIGFVLVRRRRRSYDAF